MQFQETDGRIWAEDQAGKLVAEITFPETAPGVYTMDHPFVDPSLRGQGMADQLVRAALAQIREQLENLLACHLDLTVEVDPARAMGYGLSNPYIAQMLTAENTAALYFRTATRSF